MKHLMESMINIFVSIVHDIELKPLESTINKQCNIPKLNRRMTVVLPQPK